MNELLGGAVTADQVLERDGHRVDASASTGDLPTA
jgi:hypothetical protein